MNTLTSNEKLIDDFAAAVRSEYANSTPYTRRELDETRAALLAERNTIETGEPLIHTLVRGYIKGGVLKLPPDKMGELLNLIGPPPAQKASE